MSSVFKITCVKLYPAWVKLKLIIPKCEAYSVSVRNKNTNIANIPQEITQIYDLRGGRSIVTMIVQHTVSIKLYHHIQIIHNNSMWVLVLGVILCLLMLIEVCVHIISEL